MRIESKTWRELTIEETFVQRGAGLTGAVLPVRLFGIRQSEVLFIDQDCPPFSLLIFEPFSKTVRPYGLRVNKQPKPQRLSETKRQQMTLNKESVANCSLAA